MNGKYSVQEKPLTEQRAGKIVLNEATGSSIDWKEEKSVAQAAAPKLRRPVSEYAQKKVILKIRNVVKNRKK